MPPFRSLSLQKLMVPLYVARIEDFRVDDKVVVYGIYQAEDLDRPLDALCWDIAA